MKTRLLILLCLAFALPAGAADLITRWLVITNAPIGNTNSVTLNGSARTHTNTVTGSPGTLIQETNSIGWSATNMANQLTTYRVSFAHLITLGSNYVAVRGAVGENLTLSINTCCFGYVTNSTQSVAVPTIGVRVPITAEVASNQTIVASLLAKGISDSSTNSFATNSTALSNALIKGASPLQTVASPIQFFGRASVNSNFFATNGFTSALTNINSVSSNHINFGNALRSEGTNGNSLQLGSNALSSGLRAVAVGNNSQATNTDSVAIGTASSAAAAAVALGNLTEASGNNSTAIGAAAIVTGSGAVGLGNGVIASGAGAFAGGQSVQATAPDAIGIGDEDTLASGTNSLALGAFAQATATKANAIGYGTSATFSESTAIGRNAATTTTNQIRLGTSTETVSIPGVLEVSGTATNTTFRGTNVINGRVDFTSRANSGLANGYNDSTVNIFGTNVYVRFSGPSAAYTNAGFLAEQDGSFHIAQFDNPGLSFTLLDESGLDSAANRIKTGTGALLNSTNNPVLGTFIYDATAARWRVLSFR